VLTVLTPSASCGSGSEPGGWQVLYSAASILWVLTLPIFCCAERRLVIELDGSQHADQDTERKDDARTTYMREMGYIVLRFWNNQINDEIEAVLEAIYIALTN
jgi:hypothetical protein